MSLPSTWPGAAAGRLPPTLHERIVYTASMQPQLSLSNEAVLDTNTTNHRSTLLRRALHLDRHRQRNIRLGLRSLEMPEEPWQPSAAGPGTITCQSLAALSGSQRS
jgi:hypothetical protein